MSKNQRVKTVQFAVGIDLLASKMSLSAKRGNELELTPLGVLAKSSMNGRTILIPFSNCKGIELFPEDKEVVKK